MKITIIGDCFVGLASGVCFSVFGRDVIGVEKNPTAWSNYKPLR